MPLKLVKTERRFLAGSGKISPVKLEKRADGGKMIVGYGAVFYNAADPGTQYPLWEQCIERIMPECFDRAIQEKDDARGLYNHDPNSLLGRTVANTMRLMVDARGLRYEIDLPDTQLGRDVAVSIERGDLTGSSFSFSADAQMWVEQDDGVCIRQLTSVTLFDVGPVTFPAYESTTTGVRADGEVVEARASWEAWRKSRPSGIDHSRLGRQRIAEMG